MHDAWHTSGAVAFTYYNIIYGFVHISSYTVVALTESLCCSGPNSSEVLARPYKIVSSVWLWASCVVDLSNTTVLYYLLRTHVVGYNERSDSLARRISRLAIETASYVRSVFICHIDLTIRSLTPSSVFVDCSCCSYRR